MSRVETDPDQIPNFDPLRLELQNIRRQVENAQRFNDPNLWELPTRERLKRLEAGLRERDRLLVGLQRQQTVYEHDGDRNKKYAPPEDVDPVAQWKALQVIADVKFQNLKN